MKKIIRKPNRLRNYDYSSNGMYFITVCTKGKAHIFGNIVGATIGRLAGMQLSPYGKITKQAVKVATFTACLYLLVLSARPSVCRFSVGILLYPGNLTVAVLHKLLKLILKRHFCLFAYRIFLRPEALRRSFSPWLGFSYRQTNALIFVNADYFHLYFLPDLQMLAYVINISVRNFGNMYHPALSLFKRDKRSIFRNRCYLPVANSTYFESHTPYCVLLCIFRKLSFLSASRNIYKNALIRRGVALVLCFLGDIVIIYLCAENLLKLCFFH